MNIAKERRMSIRSQISLPVDIAGLTGSVTQQDNIVGHTSNVSSTGAAIILDKCLSIGTILPITLELSENSLCRRQAQIVWVKYLAKIDRFCYGVKFINSSEEILDKTMDNLNDNIIALVNDIQKFIESLEARSNEFDSLHNQEQARIDFIRMSKDNIVSRLSDYWDNLWDVIKDLRPQEYRKNQRYLQKKLLRKIVFPIEINQHIFKKPFGYSGDYLIMNYIYDYNHDNYLGKSSYEKIFNYYSCNIDISHSNVRRKEYFKDKLREVITNNPQAKIMSLGCGPAREFLELLKDETVPKTFTFVCLDLEEEALNYIKKEVAIIMKEKPGIYPAIYYENKNIAFLLRDRDNGFFLKENYDLIYASGVFDYLKDDSAKKILKGMYRLLKKGGQIIICNADKNNHRHRAYYEFLMDWHLLYRSKEDILAWAKDLDGLDNLKFSEIKGGNNYLFLELGKRR